MASRCGAATQSHSVLDKHLAGHLQTPVLRGQEWQKRQACSVPSRLLKRLHRGRMSSRLRQKVLGLFGRRTDVYCDAVLRQFLRRGQQCVKASI
jgi:hypothetical protein